MGELVSDDLRLCSSVRRRRTPPIQEEERIAKRDEPRVFHRPCGEVWNGDQVELRERVRDSEVIAQLCDERRGCFEREPREVRAALGGDGADRERVFLPVYDVEVPHREGHEVAWKGRSGGESMLDGPVGRRGVGDFR